MSIKKITLYLENRNTSKEVQLLYVTNVEQSGGYDYLHKETLENSRWIIYIADGSLSVYFIRLGVTIERRMSAFFIYSGIFQHKRQV